MKKFILNIILFCSPFLILIPIELELRNNSFEAKAEYIRENANEIKWLIIGSSQNWYAINPEYFSQNTASLAFAGSSIDIDLFVAKQEIEKLPNLERIIIEVSYHSLEERHEYTWGKNHLLWVHFGINHYNGTVPWNDNLLITAQPVFYIKKLMFDHNKIESGKFNKYGFIDVEPDTTNYPIGPTNRFRKLSFDTLKIRKTSIKYLENIHTKESIENYNKSVLELDDFIQICISKGIEVTLVSPPKYYLYNKAMKQDKLERRDDFLLKYTNNSNVKCLIYETLHQYDADWFFNENHLSIKGARIFTKKLEEDINSDISYLP